MNCLSRISISLSTLYVCIWISVPLRASVFIARPDSFNKVFSAASSGDTINMIGTFGKLNMANRTFSRGLKLDATKAIFTRQVLLDNINNLQIYGGTFNIVNNGAYAKAAVVRGGANIYFRFATVYGAVDQFGIAFSGTRNAQVTNSSFSGLSSGIVYGSVVNGFAGRNKFTGSFSDGIDIADSHFVSATYNSCADGRPSPGAHPDCIQMWSVSGHSLLSDVSVSYNIAEGATQGFTDFDKGLRATISNNIVHTSFPQGVACYGCIDSNISYNHLSTIAGAQYQTGVGIKDGLNNTVFGNVVVPYAGSNAPMSSDSTNSFFASNAEPRPSLMNSLDEFTQGGALALDSSTGALSNLPELSSWLMFIVGFVALGIAMRCQQSMHA